MRALLLTLPLLLCGCPGEEEQVPTCGPAEGTVAEVVDGDTIRLQSGERVRYLMVDTPETTGGKLECWGPEARDFNRALVADQVVTLRYDAQCTDRFDRLLAYVSVNGREVNSLLVERGHACVLHIPPNGADRLDGFKELEATARAENRGLWGSCSPRPC